jgi:hypothetical protein
VRKWICQDLTRKMPGNTIARQGNKLLFHSAQPCSAEKGIMANARRMVAFLKAKDILVLGLRVSSNDRRLLANDVALAATTRLGCQSPKNQEAL